MIKNTRHLIAIITLSGFIGQLLVGCNIGDNRVSNPINNGANHGLSSLKTQGFGIDWVDYDIANSDNNLWGAQISFDGTAVNSKLGFQINNKIKNPNVIVYKVGCTDADGVDTSHLKEDLSYSSNKIPTPLELKAKGYPDFIYDPKNIESNYIGFNKVEENNHIYCYYGIYQPGSDTLFFAQEVNYYRAHAWSQGGSSLDYPIKNRAETLANLQRYFTSPHSIIPSILALTGVTFGAYKLKKYFSGKPVTNESLAHNIITHDENINLNGRVINNKTLKKIVDTHIDNELPVYAKNPGLKNTIASLKEQFKYARFKIKNDRSETPFNLEKDSFKIVEKDGFSTIEVTLKNSVYKEKTKIIDIEDLCYDNGILVVENYQKTPTNLAILEKKLNDDQVITKINQGEKFKSIMQEEAKELKDTNQQIASQIEKSSITEEAECLSWRTFAGGFIGLAVIYGLDLLTQYISNKWDSSTTSGTYGSGVSKMVVLNKIPANQIYDWNKVHTNEQINDKAVVDLVGDKSPLSHHYQIHTMNPSYDNQSVFNLDIDVLTEPFSRVHNIYEGGQDPYLDKITNDNKFDAVMLMTLYTQSVADEDKNIADDATAEAYKQVGMGSLHADLLPSPDYQLTKITDTKTAKTLYSQGSSSNSNSLIKASGWNNVQVGAIKGLVINSDQSIDMQIKIPKEEAQAKLGTNGDIIGNGFASKFVEESSSGSVMLYEIRSDNYESMVKRVYTESPELVEPYFYTRYDCPYPTKIGTPCDLKMHVGGMDNNKHIGKIYIADGASRTTAIPVYLNYHLLGSYFELNVSDKTSPYKIDIMNTHNEAYTKMTLEYKSVDDDSYKSVPMDMLSKDTTCNLDSGLQPQTQCSIYFDFSKVDSDSYQFRVNGIKSTAKLGTPDWFDVKVRVN